MRITHHNTNELDKIIECQKKMEIKKVLKFYPEYLTKYPKDVLAFIYYAEILTRIGYLDKAKEIIDNIKFMKLEHQEKKNLYNMLLAKYYGAKNEYDKSYHYYQEAIKYDNTIPDNMKILELTFLEHTLNLSLTQEINTYFQHQIVNYNEELFFEHIKKHFGINEYLTFRENIDIEEIVKQIKEKKNSHNIYYSTINSNVVHFKLNNIGYRDNKQADYIKAVFIAGTKNLITLFPVLQDIELVGSIDLNEKKEVKILKKRNRIDEFFKRYGEKESEK